MATFFSDYLKDELVKNFFSKDGESLLVKDGDQVYIRSDRMDIEVRPFGDRMFAINVINYFKGEKIHGYSENLRCFENDTFTISFGEINLLQKVLIKYGD